MNIDFFTKLPEVNRADRASKRKMLTNEEVLTLKQYGKEYFDGDLGYGGYYYDGRWKSVAEEMVQHYDLNENSTILDIGCAKGFLLYEFYKLGFKNVFGCDISAYAIDNVPKEIQDNCKVLSADSLDYKDNQFDLIFSLDCIHNLKPENVNKSIKEMIRVSKNKKNIFIRVASYRNEKEFENLQTWGVTSLTIESPQQWLERFNDLNYKGDYYFRYFESL